MVRNEFCSSFSLNVSPSNLTDLPETIKVKFLGKDTSDNGDGYAHVRLLHKNSKQIIKASNKRKKKNKYKHFSSDQLKYVAQMLLIMLPEDGVE